MKTRTPVSCRTRLPQGTCDDSPRLEPNKDYGVAATSSAEWTTQACVTVPRCRWPFCAASAVQGAWTLIKCNLVSLIAHRYVDRVMTESGCDGGGMDYGNACRSNTAFAQRRAARTPQQVARAHGKLTQWFFFCGVVGFTNATTDSERIDVGLLKSSSSPSPLRQTRLLFG